jgi:DNA-dependent protein kinase catalytic subunit
VQLEFEIRSNFSQSISAASMCQYILGIGDRHLGNMLVSDRSGKLLPIDFGHAFGSAHHLGVIL